MLSKVAGYKKSSLRRFSQLSVEEDKAIKDCNLGFINILFK